MVKMNSRRTNMNILSVFCALLYLKTGVCLPPNIQSQDIEFRRAENEYSNQNNQDRPLQLPQLSYNPIQRSSVTTFRQQNQRNDGISFQAAHNREVYPQDEVIPFRSVYERNVGVPQQLGINLPFNTKPIVPFRNQYQEAHIEDIPISPRRRIEEQRDDVRLDMQKVSPEYIDALVNEQTKASLRNIQGTSQSQPLLSNYQNFNTINEGIDKYKNTGQFINPSAESLYKLGQALPYEVSDVQFSNSPQGIKDNIRDEVHNAKNLQDIYSPQQQIIKPQGINYNIRNEINNAQRFQDAYSSPQSSILQGINENIRNEVNNARRIQNVNLFPQAITPQVISQYNVRDEINNAKRIQQTYPSQQELNPQVANDNVQNEINNVNRNQNIYSSQQVKISQGINDNIRNVVNDAKRIQEIYSSQQPIISQGINDYAGSDVRNLKTDQNIYPNQQPVLPQNINNNVRNAVNVAKKVQETYSHQQPTIPQGFRSNLNNANAKRIQDIYSSQQPTRRYTIIYPDGRVEHVNELEKITQQHPDFILIKSKDVVDFKVINMNDLPKSAQSIPASALTQANLPPVATNIIKQVAPILMPQPNNNQIVPSSGNIFKPINITDQVNNDNSSFVNNNNFDNLSENNLDNTKDSYINNITVPINSSVLSLLTTSNLSNVLNLQYGNENVSTTIMPDISNQTFKNNDNNLTLLDKNPLAAALFNTYNTYDYVQNITTPVTALPQNLSFALNATNTISDQQYPELNVALNLTNNIQNGTLSNLSTLYQAIPFNNSSYNETIPNNFSEFTYSFNGSYLNGYQNPPTFLSTSTELPTPSLNTTYNLNIQPFGEGSAINITTLSSDPSFTLSPTDITSSSVNNQTTFNNSYLGFTYSTSESQNITTPIPTTITTTESVVQSEVFANVTSSSTVYQNITGAEDPNPIISLQDNFTTSVPNVYNVTSENSTTTQAPATSSTSDFQSNITTSVQYTADNTTSSQTLTTAPANVDTNSSNAPFWFVADTSFWENLLTDTDAQNTFFIFPPPAQQVVKDTKKTIYQNGTVIEEIVETVNTNDGNEPKVIRTVNVTNANFTNTETNT